MREPDDQLRLAEAGVRAALAAGADHAEVYIGEAETQVLDCLGGYAHPKYRHALGSSMRVAVGRRLGLACVSSIHEFDRIAKDAVASARRGPEHAGFEGFAQPKPLQRPPTEVADGIRHVDHARMAKSAKQIMASPGEHEDFRACTITVGWRRFAVANSSGMAAWDQSGQQKARLEVRASKPGVQRTAVDLIRTKGILDAEFDLAGFGTRVGAAAASSLSAQPLSKTVENVIFAPRVVAQVMGPVIRAFHGSGLVTRQTPWLDRDGEQVVSDALTLTDEPWGDGLDQKLRCDHEGVPTKPCTVLDRGVVKDFIHDAVSAAAVGDVDHANGVRSAGWRGGVGIGFIGPCLRPGGADRDDLLDCERAVLVTEPTAGAFMTNQVTGDFSVVAPFAYLVEGGEITSTLPHTTIGGNIFHMLNNVQAVGATLEDTGAGRYPTMRMGGTSCAT